MELFLESRGAISFGTSYLRQTDELTSPHHWRHILQAAASSSDFPLLGGFHEMITVATLFDRAFLENY